jgi:regulatory protein
MDDAPVDPPRITALLATQRPSGIRVTVKVDGRKTALLSGDAVRQMDLREGMAWTAALAQQAAHHAAADKAYRAALHRLNRRAMSRRRLSDQLRRREHSPEAVSAALDRLERAGLLDDTAYGEAVVRELLRRGPMGPRLIQMKLRQRGLDGDLARQLADAAAANAAEDVTNDQDDDAGDALLKLARRKLAAMQRLEPMVRKRRLWSFLARRGFDRDTIDAVMRSVIADE